MSIKHKKYKYKSCETMFWYWMWYAMHIKRYIYVLDIDKYIMQGKKISFSKYNLTFPLAIHEQKAHKKGTGTASH